ncbi:large conductance mechanosensitive channel protein MscL [Ascidiimonas sp. W6]|uniref:large conductance mechanosensitive channel protein MscL n=1 Tax=Ascidiimonas meishanensis TaxID=3128903 RepID=UPI0030EDDE03
MKKFWEEFKEFAVKGNMIDIAVGVIIGASFNNVVNVLVKEVFLPPLSYLTDGVSWANKKIILREAIVKDGVTSSEEIALGYGKLFESGFDFLIIGLVVFIIIKLMNKLKNQSEDTNDTKVKTPKDIELLTKMTTLLEEQNQLLNKKEE